MSDDVRRDLDETRRLIYGALVVSATPHWELVGTLVNSIVHHSKLLGFDEAMSLVLDTVKGSALAGVKLDALAIRITDLLVGGSTRCGTGVSTG